MTYEVLLHDKGFNVLATLFPLHTGIQPSSIWWNRKWRNPGQIGLTIPLDTPYVDDLIRLASYIEVRKDGDFEILCLIERVELTTGIVVQTKDMSKHSNAVYAAGQGTGTLRNVVVRLDADSITEVGRVELFLDSRDVEEGNFDLLRQRADARLAEVPIQGGYVVKGGDPPSNERIMISGRSLLVYCENRIIIPPPATETNDIVDITTSEYDSDTDTADEVMKHFVNNHLINPADPNRVVANFVNGASAPLANMTYEGRFQTVLVALQEIGKVATAGFEVVLNASDEFEFRVLPRTDKTKDSSQPVVFRSMDTLMNVPGRAYRDDWDLGDFVTLEVESLDLELDLTIRQVRVELKPEQPERILIGLDTPYVDILEEIADDLSPGGDGEGGGGSGGRDRVRPHWGKDWAARV